MLLADIGNTHFHIFDGSRVEHLCYDDAMHKYASSSLKYISVNQQIEEKSANLSSWENISSLVHLPNEYNTMGVDRKALCLSHDNGIFIDAGSAITVDVMERGVYKGGYIFPGLQIMLESYRHISSVLDVPLVKDIDIDRLPFTTKEQISYGIIASVKALIEKHGKGRRLYFTGGDGKFLSAFFHEAVYDETLVFRGMQKVLKYR